MSWPMRFQIYEEYVEKREVLTGLVSDFQRFSIHDGPGIRTIVFLSGCPLHCVWCQNPETIAPRPEIMLIPNNCIGCGSCEEVCPNHCISRDANGKVHSIDRDRCALPECGKCQRVCYANAINISGRYLTVSEIMNEVEKDRQFFERTGGGVTFSGGEPLAQPKFLLELAREAKLRKLHTAIETSGYAKWAVFRPILGFLDIVLYDLKLMNSEEHRRHTGVPNIIILENLRRIDQLGIPIRVRLPLLPGVNDSIENTRATAAFAASLANLEALDILPYHRMGEPKWGQLGQPYKLHGVEPHKKEKLDEMVAIAQEYGIEVTLGG